MTVEAALVFPIVFFVWAAFVSLTSAVKVHEALQQSLTETALKLAVEAGENEEVVRESGILRAMAGH
ncbi:MAG: TadE/TadG family type IV pilus assembly protein [Frisingicoccus sp.]